MITDGIEGPDQDCYGISRISNRPDFLQETETFMGHFSGSLMGFWNRRIATAVLMIATVVAQTAAVLPADAQTIGDKQTATSPDGQPQFKLEPKVDWSKAVVEATMKLNPDLGSWGYAKALYLFGQYLVWKRTGDPRYLQYIKTWVDAHVSNGGDIDRNLDVLDYMLPGNLLLVLYQ